MLAGRHQFDRAGVELQALLINLVHLRHSHALEQRNAQAQALLVVADLTKHGRFGEGRHLGLATDGVSNFGPDLVEATKLAADRGVRVYTVGVGTAQGDTLSIDGFSIRVRLDEEGLKKVAAMTQGEYFAAANAAEMKKIYQQLSARLTLGKGRTTEITALFVMIGTLLALVGVLISMFRFNRVL